MFVNPFTTNPVVGPSLWPAVTNVSVSVKRVLNAW